MIDRWVIRAASAPQWGAGHMARCLVLAQAMRVAMPWASIGFWLDDDSWNARVAAAGFALGDAPMQGERTGMIVDHPDMATFNLDFAEAVIAIDDAAVGLPGADLIIHPHPGHEMSRIGDAPALSGAPYVLIDPRWSEMQPKQAEDVRSVLLAFGMIDSADATGAVLAALLAARHRPERIDIAIGVAAPHRAAVEAVARDAGCVVHVGLQDVDALVSQADVVISAGGVSLLERMAAGVVNMAVAQNDLQAALIGNLAARGAVVAGGQVPGLDHGAFATAFDALCEDARRRHDLVAAGRALVDGRGAERVARHLTEMAA